MVSVRIKKRARWVVAILLLVLIVGGFSVWHFWSNRHSSQWRLLQRVARIEATDAHERDVQELGWSLAMLGRDDEVRELDLYPDFEFAPLEIEVDRGNLNVVPWREGVKRIAAEHRLVMVMENHFVSKQREWIGAALPLFHEAGFSHYAAEAIGESGGSLMERGYPIVGTGYYTSDPRFGNVLRRAIDLRLEVLGYDYRPFSHETREEYAANRLATVFRHDPTARMLVHAGHAHVLKHETPTGQRWLASLLWERSGIEPFTIWQWSALRDAKEYRVVAEAIAGLGELHEPVFLWPPPGAESGLNDIPQVDAILVHPPDRSFAPAGRTPLFTDSMRKINGRWTTPRWPVVIAAFKVGEPIEAIPLDQVMLRRGEDDFVLWIPEPNEYALVVFDESGPIASVTASRDGRVLVGEE